MKNIEFKEIQHLLDCTYHLLDCVPLKEGWPGSGWVHAPVCECGNSSVEPWIFGFGASSLKLGFALCKIKRKKKKNVNTLIFHIFILFMYSYFNLCGFHFDLLPAQGHMENHSTLNMQTCFWSHVNETNHLQHRKHISISHDSYLFCIMLITHIQLNTST